MRHKQLLFRVVFIHSPCPDPLLTSCSVSQRMTQFHHLKGRLVNVREGRSNQFFSLALHVERERRRDWWLECCSPTFNREVLADQVAATRTNVQQFRRKLSFLVRMLNTVYWVYFSSKQWCSFTVLGQTHFQEAVLYHNDAIPPHVEDWWTI